MLRVLVKRKREMNSSTEDQPRNSRDWSALPDDVITHIFGNLVSLVDFFNCRIACPSWDRALRGKARQLDLAAFVDEVYVPWMLLTVKAAPNQQPQPQQQDEFRRVLVVGNTVWPVFTDIGDAIPAVELPGRHTRRGHHEICLGSAPTGWVVMANDFGYARVLNPITGDSAPLPPIWRLPYIDVVHGYDGCVTSFVYQDEHHRRPGPGVEMSFAGLCDLVLLKAVILNIGNGGATVAVIFRKEKEFAIARTDQRSWWIVHSELDAIVDMVHHNNGKLFTVHMSGKVACWNVDLTVRTSPTILESVVVIDSPYHYIVKSGSRRMSREYEDGDRAGQCSYLAEGMCGKLYLIKRVYKYEQIDGGRTQRRRTATFNAWVMTWSKEGMMWDVPYEPITGDHSVFVSYTGSMSVLTDDNVLEGGYIYFTEESFDYIGGALVQDFGVRMLKIKQKRSNKGRGKDDKEDVDNVESYQVKWLGQCMNWPAPLWYFPSLRELGTAPPAVEEP
uniref:KIB1-4 beta-propeller domain-containing protein n=1 Tax=Leersia perrieri TaxID=77586 RepID=A0A0D9WX53_9ORYZ